MFSRRGGAVGGISLPYSAITLRRLTGTPSFSAYYLSSLACGPEVPAAGGRDVPLSVLAHISMNRRHRLRRSSDFARVRLNGRSWAHRLLVLAVVPNELEVSRFGFVVSRRVGGAVRRNGVRRLLRETTRRNMSSIPNGWDCVLIARTPLSVATFSQTEVALVQLLQRAFLWRPSEGEDRPMESGAGRTGLRKQLLSV